MGELILAGLGLHDENGMSLQCLEEVKSADFVFLELYTSPMQALILKRLGDLCGKDPTLVSREMLEDECGREILEASKKGKTVFLVPGDPLIATTHVDLQIRAKKAGIRTNVIHGVSIMSAAIGLSGLQNYRFGRSVTIPFADVNTVSETPYDVLKLNMRAGLHTLCFLDVKAEEKRYMTVGDALEVLTAIERKRKESVITENTLVVAVARAGSPSSVVKAAFVNEALNFNFGPPPHIIIFPGKLHFMEADALVELAAGPESIKELSH